MIHGASHSVLAFSSRRPKGQSTTIHGTSHSVLAFSSHRPKGQSEIIWNYVESFSTTATVEFCLWHKLRVACTLCAAGGGDVCSNTGGICKTADRQPTN